MNKINIGVIDFEEEYVSALSAYLQKYGKGKWDIFGFTRLDNLKKHLIEHTMDLVIGTNQADLKAVCEEGAISGLLLDEAFSGSEKTEDGIYMTKRFQKAMGIGKIAESIIQQKIQEQVKDVICVAIYSPVGRCGKTALALDIAKNNYYGRWMYIGLEDYASFGQTEDDKEPDEAIYFWKERKGDAFLEVVKELEGVLGTGTSLFDRKHLNEEDYRWLKGEVLKEQYKGIIFDLGSGVVNNPNIFNVFDKIVVPFVSKESALQKKHRFERMLKQHAMEGVLRRCYFVCMDKSKEVEQAKEVIFGGMEK
ncbi:MAG: hypothetical protein E7264_03105 [Lachnospiraceae bacterium]|nr:hypothetical protein [Lachnospiraceae bacterium]